MRILIRVMMVAVLIVGVSVVQARVPCAKWNKYKFFKKATPVQVQGCLERGAFIVKKTKKPRATPIHRAAEFTQHPEVIAMLIQSGEDVTAPAFGFIDEQKTPLHLAAEYNENPDVVRLLVAAGADPNARDKKGYTPLHLAMLWKRKYEKPAVIQALVDAGADPNSRTPWGSTPMEYADHPVSKRILAAAGGVLEQKPKTKSGLGALVAGVAGATIATAAGMNEDEALGVGQDAGNTVLTGRPTTAATSAAITRTREQEAAILRDLALADATAEATAQAVSDALIDARIRELGLDPAHFDAQHLIRQRLREQEESRLKIEPVRIQGRNDTILKSDCKCIRIKASGEYGCLDGLIVPKGVSEKRLCDIYR